MAGMLDDRVVGRVGGVSGDDGSFVEGPLTRIVVAVAAVATASETDGGWTQYGAVPPKGATLRMSTRGWGESKPVAPNAKPDGKDDPGEAEGDAADEGEAHADRALALERQGIEGLGFYPEERRTYPQGSVAADDADAVVAPVGVRFGAHRAQAAVDR